MRRGYRVTNADVPFSLVATIICTISTDKTFVNSALCLIPQIVVHTGDNDDDL